MDTPPDPPVPARDDLPAPEDPGPRFVAPAAHPRIAGVSAPAVLEAAGLPRRLDREAALLLLLHDEYDVARSFFRDLCSVPSRSPIRRQPDGRLEVERGVGPNPESLAFEEASVRTRELVRQAVQTAIEPYPRVGILLSGGTDSSAVAAAAVEVWRELDRAPTDLGAYHLLPSEGGSELDAARRIAGALDLTLQVVEVPARDPFLESEALFGLLDAPPDGGGIAAALAAARRMAEDGVAVFLTGDGGDEAFGGSAPPSAARRVVKALPEAWQDLLRRVRGRRDVPAWIGERLPSGVFVHPTPRARRGLGGAAAHRDRQIRCARQALMVAWWRAVGEATGIDARAPLLDPRVTDLAVAVPPPHHLRPGLEKGLLRQAFADVLGEAWGARTKRDQPYVESSLQCEFERYQGAWAERLHGGALERMDLVPRSAAETVLAEAERGGVLPLYRALSLVSLEVWCHAHAVA